jgi:hypothetical protein
MQRRKRCEENRVVLPPAGLSDVSVSPTHARPMETVEEGVIQ